MSVGVYLNQSVGGNSLDVVQVEAEADGDCAVDAVDVPTRVLHHDVLFRMTIRPNRAWMVSQKMMHVTVLTVICFCHKRVWI